MKDSRWKTLVIFVFLFFIGGSTNLYRPIYAESGLIQRSNLQTEILPATITQVVDSLGNINTNSWTKGSGGGWSCYPDCPDLELEVGDIITYTVTASDPHDLPIEYKFSYMRHGSITTAQDWSNLNTFEWHVTTEDIGPSNGLVIHVRNNDGHEWQGEGLGDDYTYVTYTVTDPNRIPATITQVVDSLGNVNTNSWTKGTGGDWSCYPDCPDLELEVGDIITYTVTASDPHDLPIEYKFSYMRHGSITTAQDWSNLNTFEWHVTTEDIGPNSGLVIHVRNNDGHEWQGEGLGDDYTYVIYKVIDPYGSPATITQVVDSLGNVNTNSWTKGTGGDWSCYPDCPKLELHIGEIVTYTVTASDPNDLPIEYKFSYMRHGSIITAQDWSNLNTYEWVVTSEDVGPWNGISVHVRNNDGHEWQGEGLGDDYNYQTYTVYHLYIDAIEPNSTSAGSSSIILTINGSNFDSDSQVQFGENLIPTTYESSTTLIAFIPEDLLVTSGEIPVKVVNTDPESTGTSSNTTDMYDCVSRGKKELAENFFIDSFNSSKYLDLSPSCYSEIKFQGQINVQDSDFNSAESNVKTFLIRSSKNIFLPMIMN